MPEKLEIETYWKLCTDLTGNCTSLSKRPRVLNTSLYEIGIYSDHYAEKWLLVPGRHYRKYVYSSLPSVRHTGMGVPRPYAEQISKSYSGDVSGILGESLSILALTKVFSIDRFKVAHLRPIKRNIKCPDFIIHEVSNDLENGFITAFEAANAFFRYVKPLVRPSIPRNIPLESKGSITGNLCSAVGRAIVQLLTYWENDRRNCPLSERWGLISFASMGHAAPHLSLIFVVPGR